MTQKWRHTARKSDDSRTSSTASSFVHIARRYNEAADELAKIASTRGTVPPDAFSRDLHEPSVDLGSGAGVEAAPTQQTDTVEALLMAAEVMEVEQRPN